MGKLKGTNMQVKNTSTQYGIISKLLHWSIALIIILQVGIVYWVIWVLPENSPSEGFLINDIHKPLGMLVLILAVLAIVWKWLNPKPSFLNSMPGWEKTAARIVHRLLYVAVVLMSLSGIMMTEAAGHPPSFFGLFQLPLIMQENKLAAQFYFEIHEYTSFVLLGLVALHILAALKHHFYDKDTILKRMWF